MKHFIIISITILTAIISILSCRTEPVSPDRIESLVARLTLEEKMRIISGSGMDTLPVARLGIPALTMTDGPVGVRYGQGTCYPAGIALAASWNTQLIEEAGSALGREARTKGRYMLLGPCININRHPSGGRNFESFGEDPYLAARLAVAYVMGVQAEKVIATPKHFACNNQEWERGSIDVIVDGRTLREIYLPAFEAAVKEGGAWSVMAAYNKVNGFHATENNILLNAILKNEWGFRGFVVSDWGAVHSTIAAANSGLDIEMPDRKYFSNKLIDAVKSGDVDRKVIDDKVRRVLHAMEWAGLLDKPAGDTHILQAIDTPENRALALRAARESIVLLKNEGSLLPFDTTKIRTIAVTGPNAMIARTGGGGSSEVSPPYAKSIIDGLRDRLGNTVKIIFTQGCRLPNEPEPVPSSAFIANNGKNGLDAEYFNNTKLEGTPVLRRIDKTIDFDWREESPGSDVTRDNFSVRWTGKFVPAESGNIDLVTANDDGLRLWLDNNLIVDDWNDHAVTEKRTRILLTANREYTIRIEYYEHIGLATLRLGWENTEKQIADALKAASDADAVVFCGGLSGRYESEGFDRPDMQLPENQNELIAKIASINKNVCVVLNTGAPVDMSQWIRSIPAVIEAWYPGQEGGSAVADVLIGNYNPSGKLPVTFPLHLNDCPAFANYPGSKGTVTYAEGIYIGYRHFDTKNIPVLFPFGHGLSYTAFRYDNLRISGEKDPADDAITDVSVDVTNTGLRKGTEIVQLYISDREAGIDRPAKELKGFSSISLEPGETKTITFTPDKRAFSYYDIRSGSWVAEPGEFEILVGSSSRDIRCRGIFIYTGK